MNAKTFVDTNVFVYAVDKAEPEKRDIATRRLAEATPHTLALSTQVLGEFYVTATRKLPQPLPAEEVDAAIDGLNKLNVIETDAEMVKTGIALSRKHQLSYWDGLILAAAVKGGCERLLSEDFSHGATYGPIQVENPFL